MPMTRRATVLVVDDENLVRETVVRALSEDKDLDLLSAPDAAQGLALLARHDVDVLISDYNMPNLNGIQLMQIVRKKFPNLVRILFSGAVDLSVVTAAFNSGLISRFLVKPIADFEVLRASIRMAVHSRRALLESQRLMEEYQRLKEQMARVEQALTSTWLSLRQDTAIVKDGEFLRRFLEEGGPDA
jgi:DNA-binding NtrC family response regulator